MEKPKLVYIEWRDVQLTDLVWANPTKADDVSQCVACECKTAGFIFSENEHDISVSTTISEADGTMLGVVTIPRGMITRLEVFTLETLLRERT